MQISNQKPATLDPLKVLPINGQFDPLTTMREMIVEPLYQPFSTNPVVILDYNNQIMTEDDTFNLIYRTLSDTVDTAAEDATKVLMQQGLLHFDPKSTLPMSMIFPVQAASSLKPAMPAPSPVVIYTAATDVIPYAKQLLTDPDYEREFFVSLAYAYSPQTLGVWFQNEDAFDRFTQWIQNTVTPMRSAGLIPGDTDQLVNQFCNMRLTGLTEGLNLRNDVNSGNDEYSFPRLLIHLIMSYQEQQRATSTNNITMGIMPFHLGELLIPKSVVFANVEIHARSTPKKVDNEWRLINMTLNSGIRIISANKLSKLTALPRAVAKAQAAATNANSKPSMLNRSAAIKFRKRPPTGRDISKGLLRALMRMKNVNRSQNIFKKTKTSYLKTSRRDPDDYNRPGRITSTHYLPDIHIYLDTSGSISEDNYQDTIKMLIALAKKLNVNIYFSSFSHILSQEVLLRTQNRTVAQIWEEFRKIPKVSGGTNYEQIWNYIQINPKRRERFSLVITDFEYYPPSHRVEHPKNLYYTPIAVENSYWQEMVYYAKNYANCMRHIEPAIAQRMIGVVV